MGARLLKTASWEQLAAKANFRPKRLAELCGISMRTLQRECEKTYAKTPTELIRDLRCRLALDLVSQGYTNKEISTMLKFASPTHFCHEFRKVYSRSPRQQAQHLQFSREGR